MNIKEILKEVEQLKEDKDYSRIITLLEPVWPNTKLVDIAYYLANAYRNTYRYDSCTKICDEADKHLNKPLKLKAQRQWCYVFQNIRDISDPILKSKNAEAQLLILNQRNNYDFNLYKYICLHMFDNTRKMSWLERIDPTNLDTKVKYVAKIGAEKESTKQSSDKLQYYSKLCIALTIDEVFEQHIKKLMTKYSGTSVTSFLNHLKSIKNNEGLYPRQKIRILSKFLMIFLEEESLWKKAIQRNDTKIYVSDVAAYTYCPASFAINKTALKSDFCLESGDIVKVHRRSINDFYELYQQKKGEVYDIFHDDINSKFFTSDQLAIIARIFKAKRVTLSSRIPTPNFGGGYRNEDISANPDMVLDLNGERFLVEEVFTGNDVAKINRPFDSDRVKFNGYIHELNVNYGYVFYWNTKRNQSSNTKKIHSLLSDLKIFKVEKHPQLIEEYQAAKKKVITFFANKVEQLNTVPYKKCYGCSVNEYCIHKRGNSNEIKLPYKENYMQQNTPF